MLWKIRGRDAAGHDVTVVYKAKTKDQAEAECRRDGILPEHPTRAVDDWGYLARCVGFGLALLAAWVLVAMLTGH